MTRDERFEECFFDLASAMQWGFATERDLRVYYSALSSLPIEAIEQAADEFKTQAGRTKFPGTPEWYARAKDVMRRQAQTQEEAQREEIAKRERWPDSVEARRALAEIRRKLGMRAEPKSMP